MVSENKKLHELYLETLRRCGAYLLNETNETIEYNIFEEFDIGVVSFLHNNSLIKLFEAELITYQEMSDVQKLRGLVLDLQNKNEWNIESFRTSENWKQVLYLTDKINSQINSSE